MKKDWLKLLRDPFDYAELKYESVIKEDGDRVLNAVLVSPNGAKYIVDQGIPIFTSVKTQADSTVKSFEFEWNSFGFLYAKKGWEADIVKPLVGDSSFFKDKIIVDAGAGSGAQSRWMAEAGAKLVFSLELSDSIFNRHKTTIKDVADRVFGIKCDIANPPINVNPDIMYCINVIQHTKDIRQTFSKLCALLKKGSYFMFNVYTEKTSAPLVRIARHITSLLPFKLVYWLSFTISLFFYPLIRILYSSKVKQGLIPEIRSFKETWLDIYDLLGPHKYQAYMTKDAQYTMFAEEKMRILKETNFGYLLQKT